MPRLVSRPTHSKVISFNMSKLVTLLAFVAFAIVVNAAPYALHDHRLNLNEEKLPPSPDFGDFDKKEEQDAYGNLHITHVVSHVSEPKESKTKLFYYKATPFKHVQGVSKSDYKPAPPPYVKISSHYAPAVLMYKF